MLHNQYLGVLAAQTAGEFRVEIGKFANNLGFRAADSLAVIDTANEDPQFIYVSSDDCPEWLSVDPSYWRRDPVMQHCKSSSIPIVWGGKDYAAPGLEDIHDLLVSFGMRSGMNVCLHLHEGRHFAVALNTDTDLLADPKLVAHALPQLQLLAAYALDTACRLFLPPEDCCIDQLTRREADALTWVLAGKSLLEIADLLKIGEGAIKATIVEVTQKLGCGNEHQAALKALRLGMIDY